MFCFLRLVTRSDEPLPVWINHYVKLLSMDFGNDDVDVAKIVLHFRQKGSISMEEAEKIAEQNRIALLAELDEEERVAKVKQSKVDGKTKKVIGKKKKR